MKLGVGSYHIGSKSRHMEKMNGAMLWGRFSLCMKKEMMSNKEGNVICLLEKESRDNGRRIQ